MLVQRQLFDSETSTYTYLLWDEITREAAIIDSVASHLDRDLRLLDELELKLQYVLETHIHADHTTGAGKLRVDTGAKVVLHKNSRASCADLLVTDGEVLYLGIESIQIIHTPGHTDADICLRVDGAVFTGDTLLIRGCGRTDFQSGDAGKLYDSITSKLYTLANSTLVYPGHDYNGVSYSTIGEEKKHNPRLGGNRSRTIFVHIMETLDLEPPQKIEQAVPHNLNCGLMKVS